MGERITIGEFQAEDIETTNKKYGPLLQELGYPTPRHLKSCRIWKGDLKVGDFRLYEVESASSDVDRIVIGPYVKHSRPHFLHPYNQQQIPEEERDQVPAEAIQAYLQAKADFKDDCDNYVSPKK